MRIDYQSNARPLQKLQFGLISKLMGAVPGPIVVLTYRREIFGKHFTKCLTEGMRQTKYWTKPEVELFAAFVSKANSCNFCMEHHTHVTIIGLGDEVVNAALEDYRTAPVSEEIRSMLGFLDKLTRTPEQVGVEDIDDLRKAGISEEAAAEAIYVCFLFSTINRIADALDFKDDAKINRVARYLYHMGYSTGSLPG